MKIIFGLDSIKNKNLLSILSIALVSIILITSQSPAAFAGMGGWEDKDYDGFSTFQGDCDDNNPEVYPGHGECDPTGFVEYIAVETEYFIDEADLTEKQGEALIDKLEQASDKLNSDNYNAATGMLNSFINKINSYINNGTVSEELGQQLIDQVQVLIDVIDEL